MTGRVVHLVDDHSGVRTTLARLLRASGYTVKEYAGGVELLAASRSLTDGFILLDIDMPGPDGFAVQRALRERSVSIPVILMTGSGDLTVLALKAGAADFMQKPFDRNELLTALDQLSAEVVDG